MIHKVNDVYKSIESRNRAVVGLAVGLLALLASCGGAPPKKTVKKVVAPVVEPAGDGRPEVKPLGDVAFPKPERFVVTDKQDPTADRPGVELLVVKRAELPTVFIRWVFPGGRTLEFAGNKGPRWPEGTIDLTAEMLTEGTRKHRGTDFAAALQAHGGELRYSVLADALVASGQTLSHQLRPYLELVAESLTAPEFGSKPFKSLQTRWKAHLSNLSTRPTSIGARVLNRVMYGGAHAYGSPGPTVESIGRIGASHLRSAHRSAIALPGSTLIVVGDVDSAAVIALVKDVFGKELDGKADKRDNVRPPQPEKPACHVVDVPGAVQTVILQGNLAVHRSAKDWAEALVANQVLGGSASSRLFTVLRERKGLTYGIYSALDGRSIAGDWSLSASVRTPKTEEALAAIAQELALIRAQAPSADEVDNAKRKLAGNFVMSVARGGHVAARLASQRLYELGDGYWGGYVSGIQAAGPAKLRAAADRYFGTANKATVLVGNIEAIRPAIDKHCPRLHLRDENAKLLEVLVGDDAAMNDAGRGKLFAVWAKGEHGLAPLAMFVKDTTHSTAIRADALVALLETSRQKHLIATGRQASDWPKVAVDVLDRLIASFKLEATPQDIKRAFNAHQVLLDLVDPPDGAKPVLSAADIAIARKAIADWAFAGVTSEAPTDIVEKLVKKRLVAADLVRLGAPSILGLEALVSTNVWRVEAGRALRGLESSDATRALWRSYRRVFVQRRQLPDPADLEVIGSMASFQSALLLFDLHAVHQRNPTEEERTASRHTMDTLQHIIEEMGQQKSHEARDRGGRTVLERDFDRFIRSLEAVMRFPNADDRWWAARLLIRHKGVVGLRLVLHGMKDDDNYGDPQWHTVDPKLQIGDLCRNQVAPLGRTRVQPMMLAALVGRHRVAKVLAVTTLKTFGDAGSLTALRTHRDRTDVAKILALPGTVRMSRLAEAAVEVHKFLDEIERSQAAGKIHPEIAALHREFAFYTFDLLGNPLRAEVARRVRERLQADPELAARTQPKKAEKPAPKKGGKAEAKPAKGSEKAEKSGKSQDADDY